MATVESVTIYEDENVEVSLWWGREIMFVRDDCMFSLTLEELRLIERAASEKMGR